MKRSPIASGEFGARTRRQSGVIARQQMLAAGMNRWQIDRMLATGLLRPQFPGVYLLSGAGRGWQTHLHAALLALGERAVLSHRTAGALWGICERPEEIEALRFDRGRRPPRGIKTYRRASIPDDEWLLLEGLRVTTVARTLLDLAAVLNQDELEAAIESADRQGRLDHAAMHLVLGRGKRKGVAALRRQYRRRDPRLRPTRSDFERQVLAAMRRRRGFELPESNQIVAGREVDLFWRRKRLMVELDGHRHHSGDSSFDADRTRDLDMERRGYRVLRISWGMWRDDPEAVLDSIATILSERPDCDQA